WSATIRAWNGWRRCCTAANPATTAASRRRGSRCSRSLRAVRSSRGSPSSVPSGGREATAPGQTRRHSRTRSPPPPVARGGVDGAVAAAAMAMGLGHRRPRGSGAADGRGAQSGGFPAAHALGPARRRPTAGAGGRAEGIGGRPAPGAHGAGRERRAGGGVRPARCHGPGRGLFRLRSPSPHRVPLRPVPGGAVAGRGRGAWMVADPWRAQAGGIRPGAGHLRRSWNPLPGAGSRQHHPAGLRHGRVPARAGGQGAVRAVAVAAGARALSLHPVARLLLPWLLLALAACASLDPQQVRRSVEIADAARPVEVECQRADACAVPSPLREAAGEVFAASTPEQPRHRALILDHGTDALLARVNLIRSATTSLDVQTYIFDEDDAGRLILDELVDAARRGVRVRLLMDQLSALRQAETLAALTGIHANFRVRVYNPMLNRARISYPQYALAAACCWRRLNQRMHNKLFLVDGAIGITGGRNYQDDYYDWDPQYNFRDRDILLMGPVVREMVLDFQAFWDNPLAVPPEKLTDVGRILLERGVPRLPPHPYVQPERAQAMREAAADPQQVRERLVDPLMDVDEVHYVSDGPDKHSAEARADVAHASRSLGRLIESADQRVMIQTPYLVLSDPAQALFRRLHDSGEGPRIIISTNSLAATDAFIAYALSFKYKRRFLREFGFHIYEYKPFPLDAPIDLSATGARAPDIAPPGAGAIA